MSGLSSFDVSHRLNQSRIVDFRNMATSDILNLFQDKVHWTALDVHEKEKFDPKPGLNRNFSLRRPKTPINTADLRTSELDQNQAITSSAESQPQSNTTRDTQNINPPLVAHVRPVINDTPMGRANCRIPTLHRHVRESRHCRRSSSSESSSNQVSRDSSLQPLKK